MNAMMEWIYEIFTDELDPAETIDFLRLQMDRVNLCEIRQLYEYLHWSIKHGKGKHAYRNQWLEAEDLLLKQIMDLERQETKYRRIIYVAMGKGNRAYCLFSDNQWRIWDATDVLNSQTMQAQLRNDPGFLKNRISVINGTLAWDVAGDGDPYLCIDVDPIVIYEQGEPISMEELVRLTDLAKYGGETE